MFFIYIYIYHNCLPRLLIMKLGVQSYKNEVHFLTNRLRFSVSCYKNVDTFVTTKI